MKNKLVYAKFNKRTKSVDIITNELSAKNWLINKLGYKKYHSLARIKTPYDLLLEYGFEVTTENNLPTAPSQIQRKIKIRKGDFVVVNLKDNTPILINNEYKTSKNYSELLKWLQLQILAKSVNLENELSDNNINTKELGVHRFFTHVDIDNEKDDNKIYEISSYQVKKRGDI